MPGSSEAGVGSGALTMSLLRAVGDAGLVSSELERRQDFADVATANVETFFGGPHRAAAGTVGDLAESLVEPTWTGSVSHMLAPWDCLEAASRALETGGVLICYVATATQLSRTAEAMREHGTFTEPSAWSCWSGAGTWRAARTGSPRSTLQRAGRRRPAVGW